MQRRMNILLKLEDEPCFSLRTWKRSWHRKVQTHSPDGLEGIKESLEGLGPTGKRNLAINPNYLCYMVMHKNTTNAIHIHIRMYVQYLQKVNAFLVVLQSHNHVMYI